VKQICDVAAQHARQVYSGVGDFRRGGREEKKGGDRFRCAARDIDVKGQPLSDRENQSRRRSHGSCFSLRAANDEEGKRADICF